MFEVLKGHTGSCQRRTCLKWEINGELSALDRKGDQAWRKKIQSISTHPDVGIEADIIDTGLFVHLAQQLHQVLSIKR